MIWNMNIPTFSPREALCVLRVAAYLFFHQSRQCQDDKLVCQMVSGTKFSRVKNIYVTENRET